MQALDPKYVSMTGQTDNTNTSAPDHESTTCCAKVAKVAETAGKVALPTAGLAGIGFGGIAAASGITSLVGTTVSVSECGAVIAGALSITGAGASAFGIGLVVGFLAFIGLIIGIIWACRGTQDTINGDIVSKGKIVPLQLNSQKVIENLKSDVVIIAQSGTEPDDIMLLGYLSFDAINEDTDTDTDMESFFKKFLAPMVEDLKRQDMILGMALTGDIINWKLALGLIHWTIFTGDEMNSNGLSSLEKFLPPGEKIKWSKNEHKKFTELDSQKDFKIIFQNNNNVVEAEYVAIDDKLQDELDDL